MNKEFTVIAKTRFLEKESNPEKKEFLFAYTISIENRSDVVATLTHRHWYIVDGNEETQEVQGVGVVGEQPTLQPGEQYQYTSGAVLKTHSGLMHGNYTMRDESGDDFTIEIPPFSLVVPGKLH